jgi:hypothetical protein
MTAQNAAALRTFFSSSIAVSDAVTRLPTSGLSPWGVAVVLGSAYSLVNSFVCGGPVLIPCVGNLMFSDCLIGLLWYVVHVFILLGLRVYCVW